MPSAYVKNVEDLIFYEYAKLINKAAKMNPNNFAFRTSVWKKLKSGEISMSDTNKEWDKELEAGRICAYCGNKENLQRDHIIPKSKGGPDGAQNAILACRSCNIKKSNKDIFEFCSLLQIEMPRIVKGKILKMVYSEHANRGTLQKSDIDGDGKLNLSDLCAIFNN